MLHNRNDTARSVRNGTADTSIWTKKAITRYGEMRRHADCVPE